jgi:hypothetical protein
VCGVEPERITDPGPQHCVQVRSLELLDELAQQDEIGVRIHKQAIGLTRPVGGDVTRSRQG